MKVRQNHKSSLSNGFTLVEIIVSTLTFSLFTLFLTVSVILAFRYVNNVEMDVRYQQSTQNVMDIVTSELQQAKPNPDPGVFGNTPTGYMSIIPYVGPVGVLMPNPNTKTSNYLLFTEPNPATFDPSQTGFSVFNPANYQKVKYYVQNQILYRKVTTYTSSGTQDSEDESIIAENSEGSIYFTVTLETSITYSVKVGFSNEPLSPGQRKVSYLLSQKVNLLVE